MRGDEGAVALTKDRDVDFSMRLETFQDRHVRIPIAHELTRHGAVLPVPYRHGVRAHDGHTVERRRIEAHEVALLITYRQIRAHAPRREALLKAFPQVA